MGLLDLVEEGMYILMYNGLGSAFADRVANLSKGLAGALFFALKARVRALTGATMLIGLGGGRACMVRGGIAGNLGFLGDELRGVDIIGTPGNFIGRESNGSASASIEAESAVPSKSDDMVLSDSPPSSILPSSSSPSRSSS
jgi:hypothetical protein